MLQTDEPLSKITV